jgi:hypothetical protein
MRTQTDTIIQNRQEHRTLILIEILRIVEQLKHDFPTVYKTLDEIPLKQTHFKNDPSIEDLKLHLNSLKCLIISTDTEIPKINEV